MPAPTLRNIFRSVVSPEVFNRFQQRYNLHNRTRAGDSTNIQNSTRTPAWVRLVGKSNSCGGPPAGAPLIEGVLEFSGVGTNEQPRFGGLSYDYEDFYKFKPLPKLTSLVVESAGEFGFVTTVQVEVVCYTRQDFETVDYYFMVPGNDLSVQVGYGPTWEELSDSSNASFILNNTFKVANYSFEANDEQVWVCRFLATGQAFSAFGVLDVNLPLGNADTINLTNKQVKKIQGMVDLMEYDVEVNGAFSRDINTEDDCFSVDDLVQYIPTKSVPEAGEVRAKADTYTKSCIGLALYNPDYLGEEAIKTGPLITKNTSTSADSSYGAQKNNAIYVTIGYVIDRLINTQLSAYMAKKVILDKDVDDYSKIKLVVDEDLSRTFVDLDFKSGNPTTVLLLGNISGITGTPGKYVNDVDKQGKDFQEKITKGSDYLFAMNNTESGRTIVELGKILIEASVIEAAITKALSDSERQRGSFTTSGVKDMSERAVHVGAFLKAIFLEIDLATGGAIKLTYVQHPNDESQTTLVIVDENNGFDPSFQGAVRCLQLNPIDGDGNTRKCTVGSGAGSSEYRKYMYAAANQGVAEAQAIEKGCEDGVNAKREQHKQTGTEQLQELILNPGNVGASGFSPSSLENLRKAITAIHGGALDPRTFGNFQYPGMRLSATLDGIEGFQYGNLISSTQVPARYSDNKMCFAVHKITHVISDSDWSTTLDADLVVGPPGLEYVPQ